MTGKRFVIGGLMVASLSLGACGSGHDEGTAGGGGSNVGGTAGIGGSNTGGTGGSSTGGTAGSGGSGTGGSGGSSTGGSAGGPDPAPTPGKGTSYYLSPAGDDSQAGTSPNLAWRSIAKLNQTSFHPGDNVFLEGGQVFVGTVELHEDDQGTPAEPISLSSYGSGRALIDGGNGSGISIYNTAGVQVWELTVKGDWDPDTQSGNEGMGIRIYADLGNATKLDSVIVDRVDVSGFKEGGISVGASPADGTKSGFSNVRISNASVHDNGDHGISSWGFWDPASSAHAHAGVTVRGCEVFDNKGLPNKGNHSGSGIVLGDVDGAIVERNVAYRNGELNDHSGGGPVGIWAWDANDVTIQHNESWGNRSATLDGGGFDLDGGVTNSVMQYNYSHDNDGPGYLVAQFAGARAMGKLVIRYNISQNDCRADDNGSIHFWNGNGANGINDVDVYHNTVHVGAASGGSPALSFASGTQGVRVLNNLLVVEGGAQVASLGSGHSHLVLAGNNYHRVGGSAQVPPEDPSGSSLDPLLAAGGSGPTLGDAWALESLSAYTLLDGSPMIDLGSALSAYAIDPGSRDFFGNPVLQGQGPDVGAHERR